MHKLGHLAITARAQHLLASSSEMRQPTHRLSGLLQEQGAQPRPL